MSESSSEFITRIFSNALPDLNYSVLIPKILEEVSTKNIIHVLCVFGSKSARKNVKEQRGHFIVRSADRSDS
jgi:hypothetical protein